MRVSDLPQRSPVLSVRDVTKRFGPIEALKGVRFDLHAGEIVGLVGDNGAGKSTLIKIISGVYQPTSGTMLLDGTDYVPTSPGEARDLGVETVHQHLALADNLGVAANLFLGRELIHDGPRRAFGFLRNRDMRERAQQAIKELHVQIPGVSTRLVRDMSGGQRQAVAIARAAFWKRRILLLDEPTAALGVEETSEVEVLIRHIRDTERIPMVVISHDMQQVHSLCDRVVVLRHGTQAADLEVAQTSIDDIVGFITGSRR